MPNVSLPLVEARRLAVRSQLLDGEGAELPRGRDGVAAVVEQLGYVQIDTISVVERAHHHVLWARCPDYRPEMLDGLQAIERRVFEYWAHAMAYLPMADYRYYVPQMNRIRAGGTTWMGEWRAKHGDVIDAVLARIRAEGALTSEDFEAPPGAKRGTWWDWKPAKRALELLLWQGDLMVTARRRFQKVYDLTERVLPAGVDASPASDAACGRFQVRRALAALGVALEGEIAAFAKVAERSTVKRSLEELTEAGEVATIDVEGGGRTAHYALAARLDAVPRGASEARVVLLSPFDGLIIQRARAAWLFGFDYALECYRPEAKRMYGYFVLPILFGERLVGRLDPKADREAGRLVIKTLWLEPGFDAGDAFLRELAAALARFAAFNGCASVDVERISPAALRRALARHVRAAVRKRGAC